MTDIRDPILKPYFIRIDTGNFSVVKEVIPVEGNTYLKYIGHYVSLADSLLAIMKILKPLPEEKKQYNTIKEYLETYKNYQEKYIEEINKFKQTLGI